MSLAEKLKDLNVSYLADQDLTLGHISTGSYAPNRVVSGDYLKGIPVGHITQFIGDASTGKTLFLTTIMANAQKLGYYTYLDDSENAYSSEFAETLGIDPNKLLYRSSRSLEEAFESMERFVKMVREEDKDTPIVLGLDSLAVLGPRAEIESDSYDGTNMDGAIRAKITGNCLRKFYSLARDQKLAVIIVNQTRSKVGVIYGDPETAAAGGKSLDFYLGVNLRTSSSKAKAIKENGIPVGVEGKVVNKKNKVSVPFLDCEYRVYFDVGLDPFFGVLPLLERDKIVSKAGAWYTYKETKFQSKNFEQMLKDGEGDLKTLRPMFYGEEE